MEQNAKYLPIGSVVLLNNAYKRVMIIGYCIKSLQDDKIYDYTGVLFPEGIITSKEFLLFNHANISKVYSLGYSDEESINFINTVKKAVDNNDDISARA